MAAIGLRIAGGLLAGTGDALLKDAQQKRDDTLRDWLRANQVTDRDTEIAAADTRQDKTIQAEKDMLDTRGSQAKDLTQLESDLATSRQGNQALLDLHRDAASGKIKIGEIQEENKGAIARLEKEHQLSDGDIKFQATDQEGKSYGIAANGKKYDLGIQQLPKSAETDAAGITQLRDNFTKSITDPKTLTTNKVVDLEGAARAAVAMGKPSWARSFGYEATPQQLGDVPDGKTIVAPDGQSYTKSGKILIPKLSPAAGAAAGGRVGAAGPSGPVVQPGPAGPSGPAGPVAPSVPTYGQ